MLVDKEGKIAFKGHPANRDLEKDIDTLLKGEALTGEGTAPVSENNEAKPFEYPEGYSDLDVETSMSEINRFETLGKEL